MVIYKNKSESFQPSRASQVSQFDFDCGINFVFQDFLRLLTKFLFKFTMFTFHCQLRLQK